MKKITEISLSLRLRSLQAELYRLSALKEILDFVLLSQMNDVWNEILIPRFAESENHDDIENILNMWMDSEREEINRLFSFSILSSIFTTAYYKIENELTFICQLVAKDSNLEEELEQIEDFGIHKAKSFLEDIVQITVPNQWSEIVSYSRIRNSIAHTSGIAKRVKLINYINNSPNINLDELNRIVFTIEFVENSISTMELFIESIIRNLKDE